MWVPGYLVFFLLLMSFGAAYLILAMWHRLSLRLRVECLVHCAAALAWLRTGLSQSEGMFTPVEGLTIPYMVLGESSKTYPAPLFHFVVVNDFFDTLDRHAVFFKPIVERNPGLQVRRLFLSCFCFCFCFVGHSS